MTTTSQSKTIYCSGIGGIGLSAYASMQHNAGHTVLGSDRNESVVTKQLQSEGIDVIYNQDGSGVPEDCDLFVHSAAVPDSAPERVRARELGIEQMHYFQALADISKDHFVIAVCGTHGKSSTTSMASKLLVDANLDPNIVVGTRVPDLGNRNWRHGNSDLFLLEACEYRRHFLNLSPNIALMLNVSGDHLDAFDGVEDYQKAYEEFLELLPEDGIVITHGADEDCMRIANGSGKTVIDADQYDLPELQVPGMHMRRNAQLVVALAEHLQLDASQTLQSLKEYRGCWRRMELKGTYGDDVLVIDDYGHHPEEIRVTLGALHEQYPDRRIVCVFQPHTHDRTLTFYDEVVRAFSAVDTVLVPYVYDARSDIETDRVDVDALVSDIQEHSDVKCINAQSLEGAEKLLREEIIQPNDVLVCMGAGDVTNIATNMVAS